MAGEGSWAAGLGTLPGAHCPGNRGTWHLGGSPPRPCRGPVEQRQMSPGSQVAPFLLQMGKRSPERLNSSPGSHSGVVAELGFGLAWPDATLWFTCPSLGSLCLGQVWEEGDRQDGFSLGGASCSGRPGGGAGGVQQVPRVAGTSRRGSRRGSAPGGAAGGGKGFQGRSITPGRKVALPSSRQR